MIFNVGEASRIASLVQLNSMFSRDENVLKGENVLKKTKAIASSDTTFAGARPVT